MRTLALLLLAAVALPLFPATYRNIVIRDGDRHYAAGASDNFDGKAGPGRQYALFERDGVEYIIRDADLLARLRAVLQPQSDLGRQQAKLGSEQAALGARQAALGAKQAALGLKQAATDSSARSHELAEQQRELARQQQRLGDQQIPLGEQQRVLGEKQREAARVAKEQLEKVFEDAIRSGKATRR